MVADLEAGAGRLSNDACNIILLSRSLTWKSDFGLFGLGFHDDVFVHISKKTSFAGFHVKF